MFEGKLFKCAKTCELMELSPMGTPSPVQFRKPKEEEARPAIAQESKELFIEFQRMLAFLCHSEQRVYDTAAFCRAYKVMGSPVDVNQQQDANEFFNLIFDQLENVLQGTNQRDLFRHIFGGVVQNSLVPKECGHISCTEEHFYGLSLEIKNKTSIVDSLHLYTQGEVLEGDNKFFCDTCKTHVNAVRRTAIKTLPKYLMLHLKRFEFDYKTLSHRKIDDRCEFPFLLDMEKYTTSGSEGKPLPKEVGCLYELEGVLVHSGTADTGHYYSFALDRVAKSRGLTRWCEFNDKVIKPFNVDTNLEQECFGGSDESAELGDGVPAAMRVRCNNAYMLFYRQQDSTKTPQKGTSSSSSPFFTTSSAPSSSTAQHSNSLRASHGSLSPSLIATSLHLRAPGHSRNASLSRSRSGTPVLTSQAPPSPLIRYTAWSHGTGWSSPQILCVRFCCRLLVLARRVGRVLRPDMPYEIRYNVTLANTHFLASKHLFDPDCAAFVWSLLSGSVEAMRKDIVVCSMGCKFVLDVMCRSSDRTSLLQWFGLLKQLFVNSVKGSRWFLLTCARNTYWKEMLLGSPYSEVRSAILSHLIVPCMKCASPHEVYMPAKGKMGDLPAQGP